MKKLITTCAVVGLIMAVTGAAQAALDVNTIVMTSCKDFHDGFVETDPWNFEIWVELDDPDDDLDHIDVSPFGGTPFTIYEAFGYWEHDSNDYSDLTALRGDYPTGTYTFDFRSTVSSLLTFGLDYNDLSEPLGHVDFTYPDDGAMDVPLVPTYEWDVDLGDGDALGMEVWDPVADDDVYDYIPAPMDTNSWTPGPLDPSHTYELEVSVFKVKGLVEGKLPILTVGDDMFEYALLMEHINEIGFTTVPEPATIALLGFGALSLIRRKKRA